MNEDITFSIVKDGETINCHVVSVIPGENDNESYILFIDPNYSEGLSYGKVIKDGDSYKLEDFDDENIVNELTQRMFDDISNFAFGKEGLNDE